MPIVDIVNGFITSGILYSIILIGFAIFGFILYDIMKTGQHAGIPNPYKTDIDFFFHYVSTGLLGISIFILILVIPLNGFVVRSFDVFLQQAIFDEATLLDIAKLLAIGAYLSMGYIIFYMSIFLIGVYFRFTNGIWVKVEFNGDENKTFNRFICESDDFYFFEDKENFRLWEGRKKTDIKRMTAVEIDPRTVTWTQQAFDFISKFAKRIFSLISSKSKKTS